MTQESPIEQRSYQFALRIIKAYKFLTKQKDEYVMSKQMLRSGTSVGALMREAKFAQSRADFVNKASIALKNIVLEMERRYELLEHTKNKNIVGYNKFCETHT